LETLLGHLHAKLLFGAPESAIGMAVGLGGFLDLLGRSRAERQEVAQKFDRVAKRVAFLIALLDGQQVARRVVERLAPLKSPGPTRADRASSRCRIHRRRVQRQSSRGMCCV
jgi:hypothetical protein